MKRKIINNVIGKRIRLTNDKYKEKTINKNDIWSGLNTLIYPKGVIGDDSKDWVSPSNIKNYALNDPLLDWLHYYKKQKNKVYGLNKLQEFGNVFEKNIYDELINKYPNDIYINKISHISRDGFEITKKKINNKIPIICQAVLYNDNNKTYGIADLLVRSDWMNKIFTVKQLDDDEINEKYYCVIDIKWSSMSLCVNDIHVRNMNMVPAIKCQLAIYNLALGNIQGHINNKAYILCKDYIYQNKFEITSANKYFQRLGHIDYETFDNKYIDITKNGIYWIRNMRYNGSSWKCVPPSVNELYPNMSNKYDSEYKKIKLDMAKRINELTLLWMVGYKNRIIGHNNGIYSINDDNCCSKNLGINGKNGMILDKIIEINKNNDKLISPDKITNNIYNWKSMTTDDIYMDFETINTCFMGENNGTIIIFMIGVGFIENNKFKYKNFLIKNLNEEEQMIENALGYVFNITKNPKIFHWGNAEKCNLNYANVKYNNIYDKYICDIKWIDMCKIFKNEPIVIKGAYNFGLKEIGKSMYNNKQIKTIWKNDINGFSAMIKAICYYNKKTTNISDLINYNKLDCKILYEIIEYLRIKL